MDIQDLCDRYDALSDFRQSGVISAIERVEMILILIKLLKFGFVRYGYAWRSLNSSKKMLDISSRMPFSPPFSFLLHSPQTRKSNP